MPSVPPQMESYTGTKAYLDSLGKLPVIVCGAEKERKSSERNAQVTTDGRIYALFVGVRLG